jgi:D-alanyl-lipoteichoic acid acyltransferase DltB (MBOAT superfamily)
MLFTSPEFLFVFLPVTLAGFFLLGAASHALAIGWLTLASFVFYGYWSPAHTVLLAASIVFNFIVGTMISRRRSERSAGWLLAFGVAVDLGLLAYFKYAGFIVANLAALAHRHWAYEVVLPIGISFFTFTQIAFLVDARRGEAREYNPTHYALFVTYFPHLIAGPILHHKEMMPQFARRSVARPHPFEMAAGLTILLIGLFKKLIIADTVSGYADPVFAAAQAGRAVSLLDGWTGALAYTFQLYFDFSGYCDMAIGLSLLFGIRLPANFNSPYKARNIADFWRRWHMTLSRFLRDYLYIPLGGNRHGTRRRLINLMLTMLLGGLWHGAGWTFVVWGGLHGLYLCIHQGWLALRPDARHAGSLGAALSTMLTFAAVVVAWVYFRAPDIASANAIVLAMSGFGAASGAAPNWVTVLELAGLTAVVLIFPNTQQIMARARPVVDRVPYVSSWWTWRPSLPFALATGALGGVTVMGTIINHVTLRPFLYFQF